MINYIKNQTFRKFFRIEQKKKGAIEKSYTERDLIDLAYKIHVFVEQQPRQEFCSNGLVKMLRSKTIHGNALSPEERSMYLLDGIEKLMNEYGNPIDDGVEIEFRSGIKKKIVDDPSYFTKDTNNDLRNGQYICTKSEQIN